MMAPEQAFRCLSCRERCWSRFGCESCGRCPDCCPARRRSSAQGAERARVVYVPFSASSAATKDTSIAGPKQEPLPKFSAGTSSTVTTPPVGSYMGVWG